jgi:hypothetical protein
MSITTNANIRWFADLGLADLYQVGGKNSSRLRAWNSARSPFTRICRNWSHSAVPRPTTPLGRCGFLNRSSPASGSGLMLTMDAPASLASSSVPNMRGWLVPGFCPTMRMRSALTRSSSVTLPLPTPSTGTGRHTAPGIIL